MLEGIVFVIVFILGFAFGLVMPFILFKLGFYKKDTQVFSNNEPVSNVQEILDEYINGARGD